MRYDRNSLTVYRPEGTVVEELFFRSDREHTSEQYGALLQYALQRGVRGNVWQCYVAEWLAKNENAFSLGCERRDPAPYLRQAVQSDMRTIWELYHADLGELDGWTRPMADTIAHAACDPAPDRASKLILQLRDALSAAPNCDAFTDALQTFYKRYGVGVCGLYVAFRIEKPRPDAPVQLCPIYDPDVTTFDHIVGYEFQKQQVSQNTLAFLAGRPSNNVLLYGDGGTGKSTTIKALLGEYADDGLRIVEVYKHQFNLINEIVQMLRKRNQRFVLYFDDLSFEEFETEYKYFKALIDGGLECRPQNVRIYATSNRRHLIRETFRDKNDMEFQDDLHRSDTLQEKLSLAARFGLSLFYPSPTQQEYLHIVHTLAQRYNVDLDAAELERQALQWQMRNSGKSGRTAQQFIDSLLGKPQE